jgi:hypothetical protein
MFVVMLCIARREAKNYAVVEVSDLIPEMNVWSRVHQYHGDPSRGSAGLILRFIEGVVSASDGLPVVGESPPRYLLHLRSREHHSPTANAYAHGDACCSGR